MVLAEGGIGQPIEDQTRIASSGRFRFEIDTGGNYAEGLSSSADQTKPSGGPGELYAHVLRSGPRSVTGASSFMGDTLTSMIGLGRCPLP